MKTSIYLFFFVLSSSLAFGNKVPPKHSVNVRSRQCDIFYFKVDKVLIGASIEVYNDCDELIASNVISDRKSIVDFYYQDPGTYTIKIKKNDTEEKFVYLKETFSHFYSAASEKPVMIVGL